MSLVDQTYDLFQEYTAPAVLAGPLLCLKPSRLGCMGRGLALPLWSLTVQQAIEYQDVDPSAPFYVKGASAIALAPYVLGQIVAPVAVLPPAPAKQGLAYRGNGALPLNFYDDAA